MFFHYSTPVEENLDKLYCNLTFEAFLLGLEKGIYKKTHTQKGLSKCFRNLYQRKIVETKSCLFELAN